MDSNKKNIKILFLYSGSRKDKFSGRIGIDYPDTQFYGLNHLGKSGISAEYKEWSDLSKNGFLGRVLGFRIRHLLLYFFVKNYDIVFGSSVFYLTILKKIFKPTAKFVLLNMGMGRTLSANKKSRIKSKIIDLLMKELNGIVCLSSFQKEHIEKNHPFLNGKVFFVPLGVDTSYYSPRYENRGDYILSAGRDNGRDYRTLIEVARLMPEKEFHIVCSKRNIEGIIDIPENVRIFYDLPLSELQKKYQEAGLLLLITHDDLFQDGADCSGQTVLLDAMANGLPVIVSRKKYLADYVIDGKEAVFVDFYDPVKIKAAIESLGSAELRKGIAVRARERAEREFSTKRMAENLTGVFLSLP